MAKLENVAYPPSISDAEDLESPVPGESTVVETRKTGPVYHSQGHRLLCGLADTSVAIGARVGSPKQTVSAWRTGRKKPSPAMRIKIALAYPNVPVSAWDEQPRDGRGKAAARSAEAPAGPSPGASTLDVLEGLLLAMMAVAGDARSLASERTRAVAETRALLRQRDALVAQAEQRALDLEAELVRHPRFQVFKQAVLRVVKRHPAVLRELEAELGGEL